MRELGLAALQPARLGAAVDLVARWHHRCYCPYAAATEQATRWHQAASADSSVRLTKPTAATLVADGQDYSAGRIHRMARRTRGPANIPQLCWSRSSRRYGISSKPHAAFSMYFGKLCNFVLCMFHTAKAAMNCARATYAHLASAEVHKRKELGEGESHRCMTSHCWCTFPALTSSLQVLI